MSTYGQHCPVAKAMEVLDERRTRYPSTPRGHELKDIVDGLGAWGARWGELGDQDLDPHLLMWEIHRKAPIDAWPSKRTTLAFRLSGVARKAWWPVGSDGRADICDVDPGYDVTATISGSLLTQLWRGDVSWFAAVPRPAKKAAQQKASAG